MSNIVKGRVANVDFATDFLTTQTQVTSVALRNLNLETEVDKMTTMLPSTLTSLTLNNGLLTTFPSDFADFKKLSNLYVLQKCLESCE